MMFRTSNPAMRGLRQAQTQGVETAATYGGVTVKALYFAGLTIAAAVFGAFLLFSADPQTVTVILIVSLVVSLVFGLAAAFAPRTIPVTGSLYAAAQGILMGAISAIVGAVYGGVVLAALLSTAGVFGVMLLLYRTGVIKVTQKFKAVMVSALITVVLINLAVMLIWVITRSDVIFQMFYGNSGLSILISVVMVLLASLFILVDLSEIDMIVKNGLDKKYEWRAAYGLIITLIWLYMEFLRLFMKIASRRR
ncbi:MAG: Bax inhibitor-1/YccA family protein [Firmicutes bacterium]|nr:Bax inhibitor-1/YccA family protein [Bacillota bacterium]